MADSSNPNTTSDSSTIEIPSKGNDVSNPAMQTIEKVLSLGRNISTSDGEKPKSKTGVLIVDLQHDFMEGGALAVPGADYQKYLVDVKAFVEMIRSRKDEFYLVQSQDFHPSGHSSFASTQIANGDEGAKPFTEKKLTRPGSGEEYTQMLWPDHCVQGTKGAELLIQPEALGDVVAEGKKRGSGVCCVIRANNTVPNTFAEKMEFVQPKGCRQEYDSYSAFIDDGGDKTGLDAHLRERGIESLIMFGLATDYCVFFSAADAVKCGFQNVFVVKELCRGIDPSFDWTKYTESGCTVTSLDKVKECLQKNNKS